MYPSRHLWQKMNSHFSADSSAAGGKSSPFYFHRQQGGGFGGGAFGDQNAAGDRAAEEDEEGFDVEEFGVGEIHGKDQYPAVASAFRTRSFCIIISANGLNGHAATTFDEASQPL